MPPCDKPTKIFMASKTNTLKDIRKIVSKNLNIAYSDEYTYRLWVRVRHETYETIDSDNNNNSTYPPVPPPNDKNISSHNNEFSHNTSLPLDSNGSLDPTDLPLPSNPSKGSKRFLDPASSSDHTISTIKPTPPTFPLSSLYPGGKRLCTVDVTDTDGEWKYVREPDDTKLYNLLRGDINAIDLLIEKHVSYHADLGILWQRDGILHRWKDYLEVGDVVDAVDQHKKWYEAVITEKSDKEDGLKVHYVGWASRFDIFISKKDFKKCIQPLYSQLHTNWRKLLTDKSFVDVKIGDLWYVGQVIEIDELNNTIKVQYNLPPSNSKMEYVLNIYSDEVCRYGTHTESKSSSTAVVPRYAGDVSNSSALSSSYSNGYSNNYSLYNKAPSGVSSWYSSGRTNTRGVPVAPGAVGIQNIGNTCYMASMLQCLNSTQVLTDIFLKDDFKLDLNKDNVLGHGGKIALSYAKLIRDIHSNLYSIVVPDEFKQMIGEFQNQFCGSQQQDSQEFMMVLLDGLHEDLNRIKKKPFVTKIESKGRPDNIIAIESWRRYLLRNDSIILDKCFGLLKSHVTCAGCGNESVTFEPYSSLSLPIPIKMTKKLSLVFFPLPLGSRPIELHLDVPTNGIVKDLKKLIIEKCNVALQTNIFLDPNDNINDHQKMNGHTSLQQDEESMDISMDVTTGLEVQKSTPVVMDETNETTKELETVSMNTSDTPMEGVEASFQAVEVEVEKDFVLVNREDASEMSDSVIVDHPKATNSSESDIMKTDVSIENHITSNEIIPKNIDEKKLKEVDMNSSENSVSPDQPLNSMYDTKTSDVHIQICFASKSDTFGKIYNILEDTKPLSDINMSPHQVMLAYQLSHKVIVKPNYDHYNNYNYSSSSSFGFSGPNSFNMNNNTSRNSSMQKNNDMNVTSSIDGISVEIIPGVMKPNKYNSMLQFQQIMSSRKIAILVNTSLSSSTSKYSAPISQHEEQAARKGENDNAGGYTRKYIHYLIWNLMRPCIRSDSPYRHASNKPYILYASTSTLTSTPLVPPYPEDDMPVDVQLFPPTYFYCIWKDEAITEEHFNIAESLPLPVPPPMSSSELNSPGALTLYSCLNKFLEREQLQSEQTIYCKECKQHLAPIKKFDIWSSPDVLILHLKRFQYTPGQFIVHREKINELVTFPLQELDLTNYVKGIIQPDAPPVYDLYAVSEHSGGLGGGHYTAICQNFSNGKWYVDIYMFVYVFIIVYDGR